MDYIMAVILIFFIFPIGFFTGWRYKEIIDKKRIYRMEIRKQQINARKRIAEKNAIMREMAKRIEEELDIITV